jgi:hypothetical protein
VGPTLSLAFGRIRVGRSIRGISALFPRGIDSVFLLVRDNILPMRSRQGANMFVGKYMRTNSGTGEEDLAGWICAANNWIPKAQAAAVLVRSKQRARLQCTRWTSPFIVYMPVHGAPCLRVIAKTSISSPVLLHGIMAGFGLHSIRPSAPYISRQ